MTGAGWWCIGAASALLEPQERHVVLGDLAESDVTAARGLSDVLGLALRRHFLLWKSWRPWLAAFGWALPSSFLLMGFSLSVSWGAREVFHARSGLGVLLCRLCLLIGWSWSGGLVVASIARRTLWATIAASFLPCLFCVSRFRIEALSPACLLLFLLPACFGLGQGLRTGLRTGRMRLGWAVLFAVALTGLALPVWHGPPVFAVALLWPAWYVVAAARKQGREA